MESVGTTRETPDMITWTTLTDGLVGAAAGGLAVFSAAAFTLSRTRRADAERETVRLRERDEERRKTVVAEVIAAFRALEMEVRFAPLMSGRADAGSLRATMLFYLNQRAHHPLVANWLLHRHDRYVEVVNTWRRRWWLPRGSHRRMQAMGDHLGQTVGMLVAWSVGDVTDDWFADPDRPPPTVPPKAAVSGASARKEV